ncbi:MAG: SDR family NAD(P)-dependent oxidoreductase [Legionella sp.]|nr:SDR family NAD(P)-dependent oxidoreductase [Legionella sp.]
MTHSNQQQPPQHQSHQPGIEKEMNPRPIYLDPNYQSSNKLAGKTALITGADSGIGRAVACLFAKEGANVFVHYLDEEEDAQETKRVIENMGRTCWLYSADLQEYDACKKLCEDAIKQYGSIDILVNNIAVQYPQERIEDISCEQMEKTFKTNFFQRSI